MTTTDEKLDEIIVTERTKLDEVIAILGRIEALLVVQRRPLFDPSLPQPPGAN